MNKRRFIILVCIQLVIGNTVLSGQELNTNELNTNIDNYLNHSESNGYSASVLVAIQGDIVFSKGYGWSDRESKFLNTPASIFNIGSVTKQFTAAAILKLMEDGKLNTSDNIGLFYNEAPNDKKDITIHQLLTHTTGISPSTGGFRYDEASQEQFLKEFFESELISPPGTYHQYANANYIMLAAIIELVSKQEYATFLQDNFWTPLNMIHTGYKNSSVNSEHFAHGYYFNYSVGVWTDWGITRDHLPHNENHWYSIGKGDLYSTTLDLNKWQLALETHTVLNAKSKALLETPFVAESQDGNSHYAYGWSTFKTKTAKKVVWHNGSNGIFFGNFVRLVDDDIVVIVLSNTILNNDSENVAWEISKMIFDANYKAPPVTKLSYELVYDFMKANKPEQSSQLPRFLNAQLKTEFLDKAVLNRIGFKLLEKQTEPGWGLELLKLNVQLFPNDGNLWDSLGDGYLQYQQSHNAIKSFEKALILSTKEDCYWCENSRNKLKQLKD